MKTKTNEDRTTSLIASRIYFLSIKSVGWLHFVVSLLGASLFTASCHHQELIDGDGWTPLTNIKWDDHNLITKNAARRGELASSMLLYLFVCLILLNPWCQSESRRRSKDSFFYYVVRSFPSSIVVVTVRNSQVLLNTSQPRLYSLTWRWQWTNFDCELTRQWNQDKTRTSRSACQPCEQWIIDHWPLIFLLPQDSDNDSEEKIEERRYHAIIRSFLCVASHFLLSVVMRRTSFPSLFLSKERSKGSSSPTKPNCK